MLFRDRILALVVAVAWGLNFPATAIALDHWPPFLLAAVRFTLLALPTILFVPRPKVPFRWIVLVGATLGVLQFAFLYLGMAAGMPTGLASLVIQASAPFTVVLAGVLLREKLTAARSSGCPSPSRPSASSRCTGRRPRRCCRSCSCSAGPSVGRSATSRRGGPGRSTRST